VHGKRRESSAHDTTLEVWRLSIEDICRLDAVLDDTDGAVEEAHEVAVMYAFSVGTLTESRESLPGSVARVVREELAILRAHGNQELIYAHGRVDGDLAAKQGLDVMFLPAGAVQCRAKREAAR
jgi:hypothetical protein